MTYTELAALLNGREYGNEITDDEAKKAKDDGLVVVFGGIDDLIYLVGSCHEEVDAGNSQTIYLNVDGVLRNSCEYIDCPYFKKLMKLATPLSQIWNQDDYAWIYETTIPHATFDIFDAGEKYCRGIVFSLLNIK